MHYRYRGAKKSSLRQSYVSKIFQRMTATKYLCAIVDELAKGETSLLRIDSSLKNEHNSRYITLASLDEWASVKYDIHVFDLLQSKNGTQHDIKPLSAYEDSSIGEPSSDDEFSLQITFALLVEAFAKKGGKFHRDDESPNVNTIADEIFEQKRNRGNPTGQSKRAIANRIKEAIKAKKGLPSQLGKTKFRNLQITLAMLVHAFASKDISYQDLNVADQVTKIAKTLATNSNANDRRHPDQSIEACINQSIEVKKQYKS